MATDAKAIRRYNATVERSLALFDAHSDWADYIAFLSRLLKSIETGRPDSLHDVPSKAKVALCLSRCLQPNLPSGVHQKALDVYAEILLIIGVDGLSRDLPLYLPGLSHTLAFANLSTRPVVLNLYEEYILKLSAKSMRPALKALLLSLLPVIEEETGEDFDRCLHTFNSVRLRFVEEEQEPFFWQTLFLASVSNPHRRGGILVYLNRYLPKLLRIQANGQSEQNNDESTTSITNPEPGLLVRCFATGLRDEQPLLQRGFLDLLVSNLPLNATVLQEPKYHKDLDVLVSAALTVVLRRDMSLNRRLWAWFTGSDGGKDTSQLNSPAPTTPVKLRDGSEYFVSFGLQPVVRCVHDMISITTTSPGPRTLPFRIMLSLLDRWEIGGPVVKAVFAALMRGLQTYQSSAPSQDAFDEVFRSANVFFDGIESTTLFDCVVELLNAEDVKLVSFIIANFNVDQTDRAQLHLSNLSNKIADAVLVNEEGREALLPLLDDVITLLSSISAGAPAVELSSISTELLTSIIQILEIVLKKPTWRSHIPGACASFERMILLSHDCTPVVDRNMLQTVEETISQIRGGNSQNLLIVDACSRLLSSLLQRISDLPDAIRWGLFDILPGLVDLLWSYLSPQTPQCHVVVVEDLWRLDDLTVGHDIIESTILRLIGEDTQNQEASEQGIEKFATLYHHSKTVKKSSDDLVPHMLRRAVLRILDGCGCEDVAEPGARWLMSLNSMSPVFKLVFDAQLGDELYNVLTLTRVRKLVRVLFLAEDHWRAFGGSADLQSVHTFCLSLIKAGEDEPTTFLHDAFVLLRTLYGARSGNTAPDDLVNLLVEKLDRSILDTRQQDEVLETLLAILTDKSLLPSALIPVLLQGLSTVAADERLDKWITLLCNFLPNHAAFLLNLLKTTNGFCQRIEQIFDNMQATFNNIASKEFVKSPEKAIANLLSGLEYVLARAHQQVSNNMTTVSQEVNGTPPEPISKRSRANNRLTVILCMQDGVRICAKLWAWKSAARLAAAGDPKSFQYTATKIRSRSRKILENLIEAEPQECLETLIGLWASNEQAAVLDLLQTLNGARPRSMMPAIFNAVYSRSNPGALSSSQKSSLSVQLDTSQLVVFLNEYTLALEDDMLEEIWVDCASFLKEVLANPMPHRQILIKLLRFCSILSRKMENTNFSEETRMSRELADICARLSTAIFTIKPGGFDSTTSGEKHATSKDGRESRVQEEGMVLVLAETLPHLGPLLGQYDRSNTVYTGIAGNILTPAFHARAYPQNLSVEHLEVMRLLSPNLKTWKKDLLDAFNNTRFFQSSVALVISGWVPLIRQLLSNDKNLMSDYLNRLAPPAAAGIMLGIGASTARAEADRKTQLELRRITTLLLAGDTDGALIHLPLITQKIEELMTATSESSPSLATRGEMYMLIRGLLLTTSQTNLSHLWPLIDSELRQLCEDILAGNESKYTPFSKLQGAKLLDLLLLMRPDEFQLHEWLFVSDTIDAIYPTGTTQAGSYADEIAVLLAASGEHMDGHTTPMEARKKPWLHGNGTRDEKEMDQLLGAFFGQLSIRAFEDLYSLQPLDEDACRQDLFVDIFTDVPPS